MKKAIMAFLAVGLLVAGCQKEVKVTNTQSSGADTLQKLQESNLTPISHKKYLDWLVIHPEWIEGHPGWKDKYAGDKAQSANPCDENVYELSERRHRVGTQTEFETYARNHKKNPSPAAINYYATYLGSNITVSRMLEILHNDLLVECYDGWMEVAIDNSTPANLDLKRSDEYHYLKPLLSEPLFRGIELRLRALHVDPADARISFTHVRTPVRYRGASFDTDKIGFKVEYLIGATPHVDYYDMSDDPL